MARTSDLLNAAIRELVANRCHSKITLAINAGSAATVKNTGAVIYSVDGVMYTKSALSAQAITVTHNYTGAAGGAYVQPANTTVFYVLCLNAAGTVAVVQGTYSGQNLSGTSAGATAKGTGLIPNAPADYTPIGIIKIATGAVTFTAGTTALDAANVTATYYDVSILPSSL